MSYKARTLVFYVTTGAMLLALVSGLQKQLLPEGLATQLGQNSEALCFALIVCASIQFLRPATAGRRSWLTPALVTSACIVVAWLLLRSGLPFSVVTLNEALIAGGVVALYVNVGRPIRYPWLIAAGVLAFVVVFFDTAFVLDQAESLVMILLVPVALDVMDRFILEGPEHDHPLRRWLWCGFLLVLVAGFAVAAGQVRVDLNGFVDMAVDYGQRASEAYTGWLLVHLYFGLWLGRQRAEHWALTERRSLPSPSTARV